MLLMMLIFNAILGPDSLPSRSESIHLFLLFCTLVLVVNEYIEPFAIPMYVRTSYLQYIGNLLSFLNCL